MIDDTIVSDEGKEYSVEEIKHSNRIIKSATPKGTLDWHLKWIASIWLLVAISALWAVVGFMWRDRALIMINTIAAVMLLGGLFGKIFGA